MATNEKEHIRKFIDTIFGFIFVLSALKRASLVQLPESLVTKFLNLLFSLHYFLTLFSKLFFLLSCKIYWLTLTIRLTQFLKTPENSLFFAVVANSLIFCRLFYKSTKQIFAICKHTNHYYTMRTLVVECYLLFPRFHSEAITKKKYILT